MKSNELSSVSEKNKKLMRYSIEEIWNKGNYDLMGELVSPDFVIHLSKPGDELRGAEKVKMFYSSLREAFPDIHFSVVDQVAEGDKVVTHWIAQGTHKGEFRGIPPTGKQVSFTAMDIDKIVNGKFTECWTNADELSLMQQLGVVPERS